MKEDLNKFEAVLAEWTGHGWQIVTVTFRTDGESEALEIAKDIALLNGSELICLFVFRRGRHSQLMRRVAAKAAKSLCTLLVPRT